jgi:adenylate cyclase
LKLLETHRELIRPVFAKYSGREVKTMGDAFHLEFDSALQATERAAEVQRGLRVYNETVPRKVPVRIDPLYKRYRSDPRFIALKSKVGI